MDASKRGTILFGLGGIAVGVVLFLTAPSLSETSRGGIPLGLGAAVIVLCGVVLVVVGARLKGR